MNPDPALSTPPETACQAQAEYVPGVDVDGDAVVPADAGAAKVPVPPQVVVPLPNRGHGRTGYVALEDRQLEPLLNPAPCRN